MNYYILQKHIDNIIELHIACPEKNNTHWVFDLNSSEIAAFKELGADIIFRFPEMNGYQLSSVNCCNNEIAEASRDLLDSLLMVWVMGGERRLA